MSKYKPLPQECFLSNSNNSVLSAAQTRGTMPGTLALGQDGEHEMRMPNLIPGLLTANSDLDAAAAVVVYADGGGGHPFFQADHAQVME
jgi:hypothetical protein